MDYFTTRQFYANDIIFKEGSTGHVAYILKEGSVEISLNTGKRKTVLALLSPVCVFGEMALLLKDHRRIATATTLGYTELVEISRESFERFTESSPTFIRMILTTLAERLGRTNTRTMHAPDPFAAACQILQLLFIHGNTAVRHDKALSAIAGALALDERIIEEQFAWLEKFGLIEVATPDGGWKVIRACGDHFLRRAMTIRDAVPAGS